MAMTEGELALWAAQVEALQTIATNSTRAADALVNINERASSENLGLYTQSACWDQGCAGNWQAVRYAQNLWQPELFPLPDGWPAPTPIFPPVGGFGSGDQFEDSEEEEA